MEIGIVALLMGAFFLLLGAYPLGLAWWANRRTSLIQAIHWAVLAWLGWAVGWLVPPHGADSPYLYLALCLTGCAGVAALGARRPHVGAWNFVVLGLLAVLLLPVVEGALVGVASLGTMRKIFVLAAAAIPVLNYLPTRAGLAALLLGLGCGGLGSFLFVREFPGDTAAIVAGTAFLCLGFAVPAAYLCWMTKPPSRFDLDRLWLDFRDRYGLFWGQRVREQFNHAAAHAGWPVHLYWQGLLRTSGSRPTTVAEETAMVDTMRALLKRFL